MTVRFPIAADPEAALKAPLGRASREREASSTVGQAVEFVRELTGPHFESREAAEAAFPGLLDVGRSYVAPEDRYCELMEVAAAARRPRGGQAEPTFENGRRWPAPKGLIPTVWRLSVGYWRPVAHRPAPNLPQARSARRSEEGQALDPNALQALARQSLQPLKPQQPLDIGLFERRLPEAPDVIVPDE